CGRLGIPTSLFVCPYYTHRPYPLHRCSSPRRARAPWPIHHSPRPSSGTTAGALCACGLATRNRFIDHFSSDTESLLVRGFRTGGNVGSSLALALGCSCSWFCEHHADRLDRVCGSACKRSGACSIRDGHTGGVCAFDAHVNASK